MTFLATMLIGVVFFCIFVGLAVYWHARLDRLEGVGERQDRPPFCIEPTPFHSPDNTHGG